MSVHYAHFCIFVIQKKTISIKHHLIKEKKVVNRCEIYVLAFTIETFIFLFFAKNRKTKKIGTTIDIF